MVNRIITDFLRLVEQEHGGMRVHRFQDDVESGDQRTGQAFMNALRNTPYFDQLHASDLNPFYLHYESATIRAVDFLTTK